MPPLVPFALLAVGHGRDARQDASTAGERLRKILDSALNALRPQSYGKLIASVAPNGIMLAFPGSTTEPALIVIEAVNGQLEAAASRHEQVQPLAAVLTYGWMRHVGAFGVTSNFEGPPAIAAARILAGLKAPAFAVEESAWQFGSTDLGPGVIEIEGKHPGEKFRVRLHRTISLGVSSPRPVTNNRPVPRDSLRTTRRQPTGRAQAPSPKARATGPPALPAKRDASPARLRIGIVASGADAPGLNACIRAIVRTAASHGIDVLGIPDGFKGLLKAADDPRLPRGSEDDPAEIQQTAHQLFSEEAVRSFFFFNRAFATRVPPEHTKNRILMRQVSMIIHQGGSILLSARYPEFTDPGNQHRLLATMHRSIARLRLTHLVVIGGRGSMTAAAVIASSFKAAHVDCRVLGIPASIENDLYGLSDLSVGVDTALNTATRAIDRIRDTGEAMLHTHFIEVSGRGSALMAVEAAVAAGAEIVCTKPDFQVELDRQLSEADLLDLHYYGPDQTHKRKSRLVIVSEQANASTVVDSLEGASREFASKLGPLQRGGPPSARDRIVATMMGHAVASLAAHDVHFEQLEGHTRPDEILERRTKAIADIYPAIMASLDADRVGWAQLLTRPAVDGSPAELQMNRSRRLASTYTETYQSDEARAIALREVVKSVSRTYYTPRTPEKPMGGRTR